MSSWKVFSFFTKDRMLSATLTVNVSVTAVIRVKSMRWVSHTLHALRNLLNGLKSHIACHVELQTLANYSQVQKAKCRYYLTKLSDKRFLSFMIYLVDVLESISIFSKISQEKSLTIYILYFYIYILCTFIYTYFVLLYIHTLYFYIYILCTFIYTYFVLLYIHTLYFYIYIL